MVSLLACRKGRHMTIGSGRIIYQSLPKIDKAIETGELAKNPAIAEMAQTLKASGKACHIMGLVSDGGVHAHINHIAELANIIASQGVKVWIHAFMDGRDTPQESGKEFIQELINKTNNPLIQIATISGRYYSMDRDNRWDRVGKAYEAIVSASGIKTENELQYIINSYPEVKSDEFIIPAIVRGYSGMQDGDAIIMANFRADRARQILDALLVSDFKGFQRKKVVKPSQSIGMVDYSENLTRHLKTLFPAGNITNTLGEVMAKNGLKQLRIAETEKYAHVTFFFNGGEEAVYEGEDRILVPSPKIATYDLQPEMSSVEVTDRLVEAIESGKYDFIACNYANTDMVGHTGDMVAATKAVEAVDNALGRLHEAIKKSGGVMMISADHGNAEEMLDENGKPHTQHSLNPVPLVITIPEAKLKDGGLADIAPTILQIMGINIPEEMSGEVLVGK
jgi:2,3-bisphosphoglycerate-independent phosphoglycerate mutase